jgi:hypothetical protein
VPPGGFGGFGGVGSGRTGSGSGGGFLPFTGGGGLGLLLVGASMVLGGWALTAPRRRWRR